MVKKTAVCWGLGLMLFGCQTHKADTAENAFRGYTFAALRNRKDTLKKFASAEHIRQLEGLFDLVVVSAAWPANVTVVRAKTRGDIAVVLAQGIDRDKKAVFGAFYLARQADKTWRVVDGNWSERDDAQDDLDDLLDRHAGVGKYAPGSYSFQDNGLSYSETGEPMMAVN
jgi:hypothetical protein